MRTLQLPPKTGNLTHPKMVCYKVGYTGIERRLYPPMITEFLIKRQAIFLCKKCGDITHMNIPARGELSSHGYCCGIRYSITTAANGNVLIEEQEQPAEDHAVKDAEALVLTRRG